MGVIVFASLFFYKRWVLVETVLNIKTALNIRNTSALEIIDENPNIRLALASEERLKKLNLYFPKLFEQSKFATIQLRVTNNPKQFVQMKWNAEVFAGFNTTSADKKIEIEIYLNSFELKKAGYSEAGLAKLAESLLIEGLYSEEGRLFPSIGNNSDLAAVRKKVAKQTKDTVRELNATDTGQLFLASYE